ALTPLFTVMFFRIVLGTTYSRAVYLSLVPLTTGVMLACRLSLEFNNIVGLLSALLSTLVFVTQNVFTKKILSSSKVRQEKQHDGFGAAEAHSTKPVEAQGENHSPKLDKINILFYSSTLAAFFMIPMWLYVEGWTLMFAPAEQDLDGDWVTGGQRLNSSNGRFWTVSWLLILNGISHFFQNFFAFSVLALTSPVTYSIASLIKRIVVIVASIMYFHQTLGAAQWMGVCLTFWGLWLYNSAKNATKTGETFAVPVDRHVGGGLLDVERRRSKSFFV
ncbi:suppressor of loss of ypt1, partial [Podila epigama]